MPGGLTRVAASADTLVVSMQKGGGSKDTWVLSAGPGEHVQPAARDGPAGRTDPRRRRPAEPGRRQPVLARPLRRARRGDRPPAPGHPRRADRAIGLVEAPEIPALLCALGQHDRDRSRVPRPRRRRTAPGLERDELPRSRRFRDQRDPGGLDPRPAPDRGQGPRPALDRHVADPRATSSSPSSPHRAAGPRARRLRGCGCPERDPRPDRDHLAAFGGLVAEA